MITFETTADVPDDRTLTLKLPDEVPTGKATVIVSIGPAAPEQQKRPPSSLADWAEENAEDWGTELSSEDVEQFTGRRL